MRVPSASDCVTLVIPSAEYGWPVTTVDVAASRLMKSSVWGDTTVMPVCADADIAGFITANNKPKQTYRNAVIMLCLIPWPNKTNRPCKPVFADQHVCLHFDIRLTKV